MYYVEVIHKDETVASTYQDLLSDSVSFANDTSYKNCKVKVYECIKGVCDVINLDLVMSWEDDGFRI